MRSFAVTLLLAAASGCSGGWFVRDDAAAVSEDAVRAYAKGHGLTREEARRELSMLRDADHIKELRQIEGKPSEGDSFADRGDALAGSKPADRSTP